LAIELKRKAPNAHTFLEIIRARYGNTSHRVFLVFALMTNMIVTAMLLLGGSAVVNGLTGMNISLAAFLIPIGVMIYTLVGGLKATFVADYMHTIIIFVVILSFVTAVYVNSDITGGVEGMYNKLVEAAKLHPVEGNAMGAYLTMASLGGLMFGIINIVGNFGTVFVDQAYWQRAIAAKPSSTVKGFLLGGACWFAIPFTLATTMGLTAVALDVSLTPDQVQLGLVVPAAASVLMGEVGAILVLAMLFMAVTSAGSAELIAVSSLITYDIYRTYKNPNATGKQLLRVSRATIIGFGFGMGGLAVILLGAGLSLGFVYLAMGILIGSAVIPIALSILWKRANRVAATAAPIVGLIVSLSVWLGVAASLPQYNGEISLASLGDNYSMLFGNIAGILTGGAVVILGSMAKRPTFEWSDLKEKITLVEVTPAELDQREQDETELKKAFKFSLKGGGIMTLILIVVWPMPLFFADYVFDLGFYSLWVTISIAWVSFATFFIVGLPIIEARKGLAQVITGKKTSKPASGSDSA
jgi:SSS family transporter